MFQRGEPLFLCVGFCELHALLRFLALEFCHGGVVPFFREMGRRDEGLGSRFHGAWNGRMVASSGGIGEEIFSRPMVNDPGLFLILRGFRVQGVAQAIAEEIEGEQGGGEE